MPMHYEWDDDKSERNREERGFGFEIVAGLDLLVLPRRRDLRRDYGEARWQTVAILSGDAYMIVWTARWNAARIISVRRMREEEYRGFF